MPAKSGAKRRSKSVPGNSAGKSTAKKRKSTGKVAAAKAAKPKTPQTPVVLSFRGRTAADDEFILNLTENQLGRVHQQSFGEPFPRADFLRYLQSGAPTTVVLAKDMPIGYYSYLVGHDGKMHVSALVIDPAHQSDGIGTQVMEKLEGDAKRQGVHTLEVFVQDVNDRSIAFTKKLGFTEVYRVPPNTVCFQKVIVAPRNTSAATAPMYGGEAVPSGVPYPGAYPEY